MNEAEWIAFLARPEFPAFNRAMLDNPADDLPRLVFADWMDENCPDAAVNAAVRRSIAEPNNRPWTDWPGQYERRVRICYHFSRARLRADSLPHHPVPTHRPARTMFEAFWQAGWVYSIRFGHNGEFREARGVALRKWVIDPLLSMLTDLDILAWEATADGVRLLLDSQHLRIKTLTISGGAEQIRWLPTLADRPILSQLGRLHFFMADLRTAEFETLMASPRLSSLKELWFASCQIGERQVEVIASSPHLVGLEKLVIHPNGNADAAALADSPYLCEAIRAQWRR